MSFITAVLKRREEAAATSLERPIVDLKGAMIATAVLCAFFIGVRTYEQFFHRTAGIDAFSDEFQLYWVSVLYIASMAELICFLALVVYLWKTRDLDVAKVEPREELRRIFYLLGWILVYGLAFYWGASYFSEQDAAWHEEAFRHSAFTHLNLIKVVVATPIYIIGGLGAFMYARTRLPTFASKGVSIAFVFFVFGPLMILPAAGFAEWGTTVWIMEELSVGPLHWPFVFFGWFSLGIFGVSLQILTRMQELCAGHEGLPAAASAE
ncbi:MAG TPA: methane monooxygenase/ammonia monooxygenase subunit C [Methylocella sp.]|nr:methane monooxygenase/ammonia monooxygenase subunit C [Methylocella sp.]